MSDIFFNRPIIGEKLLAVLSHPDSSNPLVHFHFCVDTQVSDVFWTFGLYFRMLKRVATMIIGGQWTGKQFCTTLRYAQHERCKNMHTD